MEILWNFYGPLDRIIVAVLLKINTNTTLFPDSQYFAMGFHKNSNFMEFRSNDHFVFP